MSEIWSEQARVRYQYRNASNLQARINLHARFSTGKLDWFRWLFDHLQLPAESRILELGCGTGKFWRQNLDQIPQQWDITLSDLSEGMLQEARDNLDDNSHTFHYALCDAQAIPFPDDTFDGVLAYHMLYHVPDRAKALSEVRRVLRNGGRFYASTVGEQHMRELVDAVHGRNVSTFGEECGFSLENGREQLARWFSHVRLYRNDGELRVTEVEPLVAYVLSTEDRWSLSDDERLASFVEWAERTIREDGAVRITTSSGLFEAC